jgi:hypothetical protein
MLLAYLSLVASDAEFHYKAWAELAKEQGLSFDYPLFGTEDPATYLKALEKTRRLLETADAFIIRGGDVFQYYPEYADANLLHQRVAQGARLLIHPSVLVRRDTGTEEFPSLEWWNAFLARYDLSATTIKLSFDGRWDNVPIKRDPHSFRDPALFAGVDEVVVEDPGAIWYGGQSLPVLIATDEHLAVEWGTGLVADWNGRELACMAVWHGENAGAVLCCAGRLFHDPHRGYHGRVVHGIDVNTRLARNVLKFLAEGRGTVSPEEMCRRIEINLVDFVFGAVKTSDDNWWVNCIPANIRQECAKRHEEEGCRFPKEAYFDLIDLKTIMAKNWSLFEPHLRAVGRQGGKDKSLEWMDKLNELRRLVGHPLKKHVAGYTFSPEESQLLAECDSLTLRLRERVRPKS